MFPESAVLTTIKTWKVLVILIMMMNEASSSDGICTKIAFAK